jgi:hypothetical protein
MDRWIVSNANPERPAAAEEAFDLSLSGEGIKLDRKIGQAAALQILAIVMGGSASAAPILPGIPPIPDSLGERREPTNLSGSRVSLREYLDQVQAKRNPDKILAIGKYLQEHRAQESFTSNDIKAQFRPAGESVPANFARDFRWTVTNGWIAEDHASPGQYYVTSTGDEALAAKFAKEIKRKTSLDKGTRRRRSRKRADAA